MHLVTVEHILLIKSVVPYIILNSSQYWNIKKNPANHDTQMVQKLCLKTKFPSAAITVDSIPNPHLYGIHTGPMRIPITWSPVLHSRCVHWLGADYRLDLELTLWATPITQQAGPPELIKNYTRECFLELPSLSN